MRLELGRKLGGPAGASSAGFGGGGASYGTNPVAFSRFVTRDMLAPSNVASRTSARLKSAFDDCAVPKEVLVKLTPTSLASAGEGAGGG